MPPSFRGLSRTDGYLPIGAYGVIGDCRSVALVGEDGSIDWLCLPRFDSPSLFGRLLDSRKGGYWQIHPTAPCTVQQRYRPGTNILDTIFYTSTGVAMVTDFMPVDARSVRQHARLHNDPRVVRLVDCLSGRVRLHHLFRPAPDYARQRVQVDRDQHHIHADTRDIHLCVRCTSSSPLDDPSFTLEAGERVAFALRVGKPRYCGPLRWGVSHALDVLRTTQDFWWQWIGGCKYVGPYQGSVWRSALALKMMTYAPTGAIVAAPTTSLPEWVGGTRNWDYRFTWLRDASLTLFGFYQIGFHDEARSYFHWLAHRHLGGGAFDIPNLFSLDGHAKVPEAELTHLRGYRDSRPVRIGNAAVSQLQLDVYGELLDSAYLYARFGGDIGQDLWSELSHIVDLTIDRWQEDDSSIWEPRGTTQPYTYSKMMCWVAVDRGLRIAARYRLGHDKTRWKSARRAIHRAVVTRGWSTRRRAFTQYFGSDALDAALLRLSQVRFLPDRDPHIVSTIEAIQKTLSAGVLVRRYLTEKSDDGVGGKEGAFFMTSFWLPDALAHAGHLEEAQRRFERLLAYASPLGLYSEEVNPATGELLGNYPQAFTHLSLLGAAVNIERSRHRHIGVRGLRE